MLFFLPLLHNSISNLAKVGGKETSMREGRGWRIAGRDRIRKQECRSEEEEVYLSRGGYSVHVSKKICVSPRFFVQIWQEIKGRKGRRKAEREEDERNWANPEMLGARTEEPTFYPLSFVGRGKKLFRFPPPFPSREKASAQDERGRVGEGTKDS